MNLNTQNRIATTILLVMALMYVSVITFLTYPVKIIELVQPYKVLNENHEVKRGEMLVYEVEYTKFTNSHAIIYRNITCEDGNLVTLAPMASNVPAGQHRIVRNDVKIPEKTSSGECKLLVELDYDWHPLRHIHYTFETETFTVIE